MQNSEKSHAVKKSWDKNRHTERCHTMRLAQEKENARNPVKIKEIIFSTKCTSLLYNFLTMQATIDT